MFDKINSHNEWDKLKEIIVGSAEGSRATLTWNKKEAIPEKLLEEAIRLAQEATPKWLYDEVCEDLDELSNVNIEESKDIIREVENYIDSINETDKDIYNSFIVDYYKEHDNKIFDKDRVFNDNFNKVESHFQDTTTITSDIELETFMGKYFVLPYQYKEFDNVYMILTKKN